MMAVSLLLLVVLREFGSGIVEIRDVSCSIDKFPTFEFIRTDL